MVEKSMMDAEKRKSETDALLRRQIIAKIWAFISSQIYLNPERFLSAVSFFSYWWSFKLESLNNHKQVRFKGLVLGIFVLTIGSLCWLSQHPINRETGYSNVLKIGWMFMHPGWLTHYHQGHDEGHKIYHDLFRWPLRTPSHQELSLAHLVWNECSCKNTRKDLSHQIRKFI